MRGLLAASLCLLLPLAGCIDLAALSGAGVEVIPAGEVRLSRDGSGVRASRSVHANATDAGRELAVDLETYNGRIEIRSDAARIEAVVTVHARGATEEEARQRLAAVTVDLQASAEEVRARAHSRDARHTGAEILLRVPQGTTVTGHAEATNGGLHVAGRTRDLAMATTNGAIQGDVSARGFLHLETTNGGVDLRLRPLAALDLLAETTNGGIGLKLAEGPTIAYALGARTTNGGVSASMGEARLEGSPTQATLKTPKGDSREVQVHGKVETTNGGVAFENA